MIKLNNLGVKAFKEYTKDKTVYIFGAGALTENCVDYVYFEEKKVAAIVDNNSALCGTIKHFVTQDIEIINVEEFTRRIKLSGIDKVVMLIVPMAFAADMIDQLDNIAELEGMECYVHAFIRNTREETPPFEFTKGPQKIPKKIHYIWVGGNPLPYEFEKNIETWRKFNPDYEIIRWDESNYDFTWSDYMREAYECKAWGFVPDVARLDIIYKYGGVYLDTDIECVGNFDVLLNDDAFFGMGSGDRINLGIGFGSFKSNHFIKGLLDYYINKHFLLNNGKPKKTACYYYQHPMFKKWGFEIKNEYQRINDIVVYPSEVLSAFGTGGMGNFISDKTLSIHQGAGTWLKQEERKNIERLRIIMNEKTTNNMEKK